MIGLSGGISSRWTAEAAAQRIPAFQVDGFAIPSDRITRHGNGWAVVAYDEDTVGCVAASQDLCVIVVGDIYEEAYLSSHDVSKSEYVGRVFADEGIEACGRLNGSYAFFIHDAENRRAFLGTDENSFIPVYTVECDDSLFFSWDVATLLKTAGIDPRINVENLFAWLLVGGRGFEDETRFEGVRRLEPGSVLSWTQNRTRISRSTPFGFEASAASEDRLLDMAADALRTGIRRRFAPRKRVAIGLSGGLDSRILLVAGIQEFHGEWISYSYGGKRSIERDIGAQVARHCGLPHVPIELEDLDYIRYAEDGIYFSGGLSLFKHGVQPHWFASLKREYGPDGLAMGCALDLVLGSSFSNASIYALRDRRQLPDHYRRCLLNLPEAQFVRLFRDPGRGKYFLDGALERLYRSLGQIPGDHPADVNDAFAFDVRIKRWYNPNLIYPLYSHRLLAPTFDHDFLRVVASVPWQMRRDSGFRIGLLQRLDPEAAGIPWEATGQPAWLPPPYANRFKALQAEADKAVRQVWFDSQKTCYIPSQRPDADFLQWIRVYPEYQRFFRDYLCGKDAVLCRIFLDPERVGELIENHTTGRQENQKILVMLLSAELLYRTFVYGNVKSPRGFDDFSRAMGRAA